MLSAAFGRRSRVSCPSGLPSIGDEWDPQVSFFPHPECQIISEEHPIAPPARCSQASVWKPDDVDGGSSGDPACGLSLFADGTLQPESMWRAALAALESPASCYNGDTSMRFGSLPCGSILERKRSMPLDIPGTPSSRSGPLDSEFIPPHQLVAAEEQQQLVGSMRRTSRSYHRMKSLVFERTGMTNLSCADTFFSTNSQRSSEADTQHDCVYMEPM